MKIFNYKSFVLSSSYRENKDKEILSKDLTFHLQDDILSIDNNFTNDELINYSLNGPFFEPEDHFSKILYFFNKFSCDKYKVCPISIKDITFANFLFKKNNYIIDFSCKSTCINNIPLMLNEFYELFNPKELNNTIYILRHILEHNEDPQEFIKIIISKMTDMDVLYIEIPNITKSLKLGDISLFWEEHKVSFTQYSIAKLLSESGLEIIRYENIDYPIEDCICILVKKGDFNHNNFFKKSNLNFNNINARLSKLSYYFNTDLKNKNIGFFGAGHAAISFINLLKINNFKIYDDDKQKLNKFLPNSDIKIYNSTRMRSNNHDLIITTTNPLRNDKVNKYIEELVIKDTKICSIFPSVKNSIDYLKS